MFVLDWTLKKHPSAQALILKCLYTLPRETMDEFKEFTEDDVKSLKQRSSLKTCSLDAIPSKLLPQCDVLLPVITPLINTSLSTGVVPREWK